jgi:hypothetical protein
VFDPGWRKHEIEHQRSGNSIGGIMNAGTDKELTSAPPRVRHALARS